MNIFSSTFKDFVISTLTEALIVSKPNPITAGGIKELLAFQFGTAYANAFSQSFIDCAKMICEEKNSPLVHISGGPTAGFYIAGTVGAGKQYPGEPLLFSRKLDKAASICQSLVKNKGGLALDFLVSKLLEPGFKSDDKKRMRYELEQALDNGKIAGFCRNESMIKTLHNG
jgi:hypothetical protein